MRNVGIEPVWRLFAGIVVAAMMLVSPARAWAMELVLGGISDSPKDAHEDLQPLLDYVVPRMRSVGVTSGRILMAKDVQQMLGFLRRGQVHWISETTAVGTLLQVRGNARPILLTERSGVSHYHTVIFVRKDSGITKLSQLRGKNIAFQRPSSTTSFFMPASMLLELKYPLQNQFSPFAPVDKNELGYIFVQSERNISMWVHKRIASAGSLSNIGWEDSRALPPSFRKDFMIIARSEPVPRALELVSPSLPANVRERLKEVLLAADKNPAGRLALKRYFHTRAFKSIPDAEMRKLRVMGQKMRRVREALE